MIERARLGILRILDYKNRPKKEEERPPLETLFETEEGMRFGSQVESVSDFAIRGLALSIILPIAGSVARATTRGIARGDLEDVITEDTSPEEREKLKGITSLMKDFALLDGEDDEEILYERADVLWFLSLFTLSIHTYLDVYTRSIVEKIDGVPSLRKTTTNYLKKLPEKLTDITGRPILLASEVKRVGVFKRLTTIEEALGLDKLLLSQVASEELSSIRRACKTFNKIRGKIAHTDPRLGQEHYSSRDFKIDMEEFILDFEEVLKEAKLPKYLQEVMTLIKPGLEELSEVLKRAATVVRMAVTYPALLDVIISALMAS